MGTTRQETGQGNNTSGDWPREQHVRRLAKGKIRQETGQGNTSGAWPREQHVRKLAKEHVRRLKTNKTKKQKQKHILPPLLLGIQTPTFRFRVRRSTAGLTISRRHPHLHHKALKQTFYHHLLDYHTKTLFHTNLQVEASCLADKSYQCSGGSVCLPGAKPTCRDRKRKENSVATIRLPPGKARLQF